MFKLYSSSAGSGKTYTLTKEYIKLALHPSNDSYYRHILAVTFTNAAAQEMKDRIMGTLRMFAEGAEHPMLLDIARELAPETSAETASLADQLKVLRERSAKIFTRILHGYSDFSVMTIDSFMSRLVGSFTDELGLPFGFETRLDSDLLAEAIDRLLARIGISGEETLTSLLENYYLEHAKNEGAWGALPRQMQAVAGDLLNEQSYLAMTRVSDLSLNDWQAIRSQLNSFIKQKEQEICHAATAAVQRITNNGLAPSDFYQSSRGIVGYFQGRSQKSSPKTWEAPNSYVIKTIEEGKWAANKIPVSTQAILDGISQELTDSFNAIEGIRQAFGGHVILYKMLVGQLYNLSLLNEIKKEFDQLLRQNNQVHISEFNRRVLEIVANDPVPFIYERLGEKYNHILIDEFQDTSKLQFANLLPLIENSLANGFFNLIVGDVKQAIYRFRGGDMELLLKLTANQAEQIANLFGDTDSFIADRLFQVKSNTTVSRLATNRRSFQEITYFNNAFFKHLSLSALTGTALTQAVYDENFSQETGDFAPLGGHVEIEFFDHDDSSAVNSESETIGDDAGQASDDSADPQTFKVLLHIEQLKAQGYDWRDIAILCRYKRDSSRLALFLQKSQIPLISDDSLLLANSVYLSLVIHLIRVIHAPDQVGQRLETALMIYRVLFHQPLDGPTMESIVAMSKSSGISSFLSWLSEHGIDLDPHELYQLGMYELCEQIIARLNLPPSQTENQYIFRFLDEVLQFENTRVSHPGDFLNWWDTVGSSLSITAPSETDAVRITTIHKSKGLEYPVVLFPYADWKASPKTGSRLWVDLSETAKSDARLTYADKQLLSAAIPLTKKLDETPIFLQYQEEVDRVLLENINLVYVAFTRPVQRLYVLAALPPAAKDGSFSPSPSVNSWLQSYLIERGEWSPNQLHYTLAQADSKPFHVHRKIAEHRFVVKSGAGNKDATTLSLKKNADKAFFTETFEKERDFGQKVRQVLIQIKSAPFAEEVILKSTYTGLFRADEVKRANEKVDALLGIPELRVLFAGDSQKVSNQLIQRGGEIIEADRIVRTPEGHYAFVLFTPISSPVRNKMRNLLHHASLCGLSGSTGYLIDIEREEVEISSH
jgi:ATP-dependent helicase/nuclease subunit A